MHRFRFATEEDSSTPGFRREDETASFESARGHAGLRSLPADGAETRRYDGLEVPSPANEHVGMDRWMFDGLPPTDGHFVELLVESFASGSPTGP